MQGRYDWVFYVGDVTSDFDGAIPKLRKPSELTIVNKVIVRLLKDSQLDLRHCRTKNSDNKVI